VRRGRLFRRYFLLILALVCGALLISGGVGLYFSYQENKVALASLQHEKALSAAARIEQFVLQIEQQLAYAALPQLGVEGLERRRIEFLKLLRVVHAVTDITQIDGKGREQLSVSRLKMDETGTGRDWSQEPAFRNARPGRTWYGPVYFRKETEPYMSVAVRSGGEAGPVTVAEVNLKFIWDVVTRIKVGDKGKAYVVDSAGQLVADPDIGLVLRKTSMLQLEQVQAALKPDANDTPAMLAKDLAGRFVLSAYAPIEPARDQALSGGEPTRLGWKVFVEQPVSEVFQALNATILRTVALMVAGLLFSALAALWLARSMARPIGVLQEGAQRIGAGDLDAQIEVKTGDELESLADQFNRMTAQLRESYAGLERKVEERTAELQETLEQQTATSDILKVISGSPTDVQPVFEAIVRSAAQLFWPCNATIFMRDGGLVRLRAVDGSTIDQQAREALASIYPVPFDPAISTSARAMTERRMNVCLDSEAADVPEHIRRAGRAGRFRSNTVVPLVREDEGIGTIVLTHPEPGYRLTDKQLALLRTFADQAVIAIENVRLFNETKESLERQTATAEILRVISSSPTDVQPVFDAILESATKLCEAQTGILFRYDDGAYHALAVRIPDPKNAAVFRKPVRPSADSMTGLGRIRRELKAVHIPDMMNDPAYDARDPVRMESLQAGLRSWLGVPMLKDGGLVGAVVVYRGEPRPFSDQQQTLLQTFADQAVIAIQNVRLFNETKESLDRQTAISEVLRVISGSPSDVKPTLDAVAERAARLCDATAVAIYTLDGQTLRRAAFSGPAEMQGNETLGFHPGTLTGRTIAEGKAIHIENLEREQSEFPVSWELAQKYGRQQSMLAVPLMREGRPFGTMFLRRTAVRPFSQKQIALATTFADQAAIGIENVRLFNETKEALEQQKASGEILGAISGSIADTEPVFRKILESCQRLFAGRQVGINLLDADGKIRIGAYYGPGRAELERLTPFPPGAGSGSGAAIAYGRVMHYPDAQNAREVPETTRRGCSAIGVRAAIFAPMMWEGRGIGVIFVGRDYAGPFSDKEVALLKTFADQAVIAIQNARLFREIQEKSAQLEIANQHKSDFLANMSHELRTPLNAIIGFSEVLMEKMFGDVNAKQLDYLKDIHESGRHLLSLINDILDLSKIEAGRMDLELSAFHLPTALSNAMTLVRERAQRHGIALGLEVDPRLGEVRADERKVKQILVNLLSNAVKFTPDGGRVEVRAKLDTSRLEIAVKDTGIGIAPQDQAVVFEEFKQVGRDYTRKAEGTGLGLALTKRFVELHGGEIRLESQPGKGSTFTFTLPIRQ
jgi:signal transduction histidine kinase